MSESHVVDRLDDHLEGDLSLAERALVEAHLSRCEACANELRELQGTVALLRGLPDPEPSAELRYEVMRRIDAGEAKPPLLRRLLRGASEPQVAAPLAAGIAVFMMFVQFGGRDLLGPATTPLGPRVATPVTAVDAGAYASEARRPPPVRWAPARDGYGAGFAGQRAAAFAPIPLVAYDRAAPVAPLRDLDAEIAEAMWDPDTFVARVQKTREYARHPLIAPIIERSARRGDYEAVARHLGMAAQPAAYSPSLR